MGFRLRKQIKIAKGLKLNISKSGISTSIGGAGHTVNVGKKGIKGTVGIPGSGLSYSKTLKTTSPKTEKKLSQIQPLRKNRDAEKPLYYY